ncbi:transposable element Tcb2 transposase [Trichonephila clavipes]|nr:transposable element Tcb2 transposase [Trichonephila clavipes]
MWSVRYVTAFRHAEKSMGGVTDEVEKLAYNLNEEAERTERPIRRLSKVMYGSTCADMQVDVMGECLSSIKHVVGREIANNQSVRRHLDAFTRGRIIGKLEEGRSVTSVAAEFRIAHSIVSELWRQFQTTGTAIRGFSSGRPREPHPQMTGTLSYSPEETGGRQREKSLDTRHRRLDDRYRVLPWPKDCTVVVCLHDALYDESRISLSSDSHHILIWRERGSRNHPSNIIERDRYGGRGVLVWGGIMLGSRTDLHIFDAGSINGTRYCNEILLPYVRLFRGAMGLQFLFMDDNAPCHRTVAAEQLLESRRLAARTLPPVTIRELRLALQDEWAAMPQQLIDTLILSMGRRCETCLAVREIISPTKDRMFLAGHPSQGCFGLQSHCAPCYFLNQASFYPSDFSFKDRYVALVAKRNRNFTPDQIAANIATTTGYLKYTITATPTTVENEIVVKKPSTVETVRLINTTNKRRLAQGHETTTLRVKEDIGDVSRELDDEG